MTERLIDETIESEFTEVNDHTRTNAPQIAFQYAHNQLTWLTDTAQYQEKRGDLFLLVARENRRQAERWQKAIEQVDGKVPSEQDWSGIKNELIDQGIDASYYAGAKREGSEYARGLVVLAASLP